MAAAEWVRVPMGKLRVELLGKDGNWAPSTRDDRDILAISSRYPYDRCDQERGEEQLPMECARWQGTPSVGAQTISSSLLIAPYSIQCAYSTLLQAPIRHLCIKYLYALCSSFSFAYCTLQDRHQCPTNSISTELD